MFTKFRKFTAYLIMTLSILVVILALITLNPDMGILAITGLIYGEVILLSEKEDE